MKQGWEIKKIPEISEDFDRKRVPITKSKRVAGNVPYYGASGIVDYVEGFLFDEDLLLVSEDGANLLARTYPIAFSISGRTWVNNHAHILKFKESTTRKYTELYLNSIKLDNFISGMAQPKLNKTKLNLIPIPLPPLPEQQRIVAILDKAFIAIATAKENAQQNLLNAKQFFESYLQGVFENKGDDWEEKTLGEVCIIKPPKKEAKEKLRESEQVTFLPMKDLKELNNEIKSIQTKQLKEVISSYTYFANNDVLLAKITPCFENGKVGIARKLVNGIGFGSSEYIVFRSLGNILPDFLYFFLSRQQFRSEGKKRMSGAVGHKRVQKDWINKYLIPHPKSIQEQHQIVNKLNSLSAEIKKLEAIYQQKINDLEELKKSILNRAFKGEL